MEKNPTEGTHEPMNDEEASAKDEAASELGHEPVVERGNDDGPSGLKFSDCYDDSFERVVSAAVPDIDSTWCRWYAPPFRLLGWVAYSRPGKLIPRRLRDRMHGWRTTLIRYYEHDRNIARSVEDPMHNLVVPDDEQVTVPALWVVELFPPSSAADLTQLVRKFKPSVRLFADENESEALLSDTRAGQGYDWFHLAYVQARGSKWIVPDGREGALPEGFEGVELTAIQLGSGLTAVVGQFHLTEGAAVALNAEWHRPHEPSLRQGKHLIADDRKWSAFSQTQRVRRQPHDAARDWMRQTCPGSFVQSGGPQPLIDLMILEKASPQQDLRGPNQHTMRALGITQVYRAIVSPVVKGLALAKTEPEMCPTLGTSRTWSLWGNRAEAVAASPGLTTYYGADEYRALAHKVDREVRDIFLALAVTEMVSEMQRRYTKVRDTAREHHTSFSAEYVQRLRQTLLTLSIDLASTSTDVPAWWERHRGGIPPFYVVYPGDDDDERQIEFTERLRSRQCDDLARLGTADTTLRDILSTVATLGAAGDSNKVSRIALAVAASSLFVTAMTMLVTTIGPDSVAAHVWEWLKVLWIQIRAAVLSASGHF